MKIALRATPSSNLFIPSDESMYMQNRQLTIAIIPIFKRGGDKK